jgi:hypothetical protein
MKLYRVMMIMNVQLKPVTKMMDASTPQLFVMITTLAHQIIVTVYLVASTNQLSVTIQMHVLMTLVIVPMAVSILELAVMMIMLVR